MRNTQQISGPFGCSILTLVPWFYFLPLDLHSAVFQIEVIASGFQTQEPFCNPWKKYTATRSPCAPVSPSPSAQADAAREEEARSVL